MDETLWAQGARDLVASYRGAAKRGLLVPGFSLAPFLIYAWNVAVFVLSIYILLLSVFVNLAIFLRNLLPGEWSYWMFPYRFSYGFIKYVVQWLGRGEVPWVPLVVVRWLVTWLLVRHFRSGLLLFRRAVVIENELSPDTRASLLSDLDKAMQLWPSRGFTPYVVSGLAYIGGLTSVWKFIQWLSGLQDLVLGFMVAFLLVTVFYLIAFVASAFIVKRGVLLGGSGRSSYFPGALDGRGTYGDEARIFMSVGLARRELPFDIIYVVSSLLIVLVAILEAYGLLPEPIGERDLLIVGAQIVTDIVLAILAYFRRVKLGRL